jgi:hypothetical protein
MVISGHLWLVHYCLVVQFHHLEKYDFVSWDDDSIYDEMENKTCLKPPTRSKYDGGLPVICATAFKMLPAFNPFAVEHQHFCKRSTGKSW